MSTNELTELTARLARAEAQRDALRGYARHVAGCSGGVRVVLDRVTVRLDDFDALTADERTARARAGIVMRVVGADGRGLFQTESARFAACTCGLAAVLAGAS
jgi:hypothetical protein